MKIVLITANWRSVLANVSSSIIALRNLLAKTVVAVLAPPLTFLIPLREMSLDLGNKPVTLDLLIRISCFTGFFQRSSFAAFWAFCEKLICLEFEENPYAKKYDPNLNRNVRQRFPDGIDVIHGSRMFACLPGCNADIVYLATPY